MKYQLNRLAVSTKNICDLSSPKRNIVISTEAVHRERRSGETCFSTDISPWPLLRSLPSFKASILMNPFSPPGINLYAAN
jgi:hypothetical protein